MHGANLKIYFHLFVFKGLTLNLLTTTIVAPHSNAIKWQMGFNSAFKGLSTGVLDKSLTRPGRKQATATEDFDFHISYL